MSLNDLTGLPNHARLWCFAADRTMSSDEATVLGERLAVFLGDWTAHAEELLVGFELRDHRFLLVAVDERQAAASGCSIDALTGHLRELERELDVGLIDGSAIWFRDASGDIRTVSRADFKNLAAGGAVGPDTPVFDITLLTLEQLRDGRLEVPARDSWHGRLLAPTGARSVS